MNLAGKDIANANEVIGPDRAWSERTLAPGITTPLQIACNSSHFGQAGLHLLCILKNMLLFMSMVALHRKHMTELDDTYIAKLMHWHVVAQDRCIWCQ